MLIPVSFLSWSRYVVTSLPLFCFPCFGLHLSTLFINSSLLLQQCPMNFNFLTRSESFFTSSAQKAANNSTIRDVSILLSPNAHKAINSIETINPRILIATLNRNPAATVISCYSPTNVSPVEEREEFYVNIAELTKKIPKHNVTLIGGDMNARIGENVAKALAYNTTNENGQLLLNYAQEYNLKVLNTSFLKQKGKLWAHTSLGEEKS